MHRRKILNRTGGQTKSYVRLTALDGDNASAAKYGIADDATQLIWEPESEVSGTINGNSEAPATIVRSALNPEP